MSVRLADTSIRQYRRRDGRISYRLRSYLLLETSIGFRLSAYLEDISGVLQLASGPEIDLEEISFSEDSLYRLGVMVHDFWASGIGPLDIIKDDLGILRIDYRISFTGRGSFGPGFIEVPVPLLARGTAEEQFGDRWEEAILRREMRGRKGTGA